MSSKRNIFEKCLEYTLFLFLSIIILLVLIQILSRYLIQLPFVGVEELGRLFFVWACFIGAAWGVVKEKHINVEALKAVLPQKIRCLFSIICSLMVLCVSGVMVVYGTLFVLEGWTYPDYTTALFYPRSLFYLPVPISGIIMFGYTLKQTGVLLKTVFITDTP